MAWNKASVPIALTEMCCCIWAGSTLASLAKIRFCRLAFAITVSSFEIWWVDCRADAAACASVRELLSTWRTMRELLGPQGMAERAQEEGLLAERTLVMTVVLGRARYSERSPRPMPVVKM